MIPRECSTNQWNRIWKPVTELRSTLFIEPRGFEWNRGPRTVAPFLSQAFQIADHRTDPRSVEVGHARHPGTGLEGGCVKHPRLQVGAVIGQQSSRDPRP